MERQDNINLLVAYFKQKKIRFLLSIITSISGGWITMLTTNPIFGAIGVILTIFFILTIIPWNKISPGKFDNYLIPIVITLLVTCLFWNKLVSVFPTNDPYKQPLRTGEARIEVIISSSENIDPNDLSSWCYEGHILLAKEQEIFLVMGTSIPPIGVRQIGNNRVRYKGILKLDVKDKSIGKPICSLSKAEYAIIRLEKLPPNSKVLGGEVIFTFNSSVPVWIPIPLQIMKGDAIIIKDIQEYFEREN